MRAQSQPRSALAVGKSDDGLVAEGADLREVKHPRIHLEPDHVARRVVRRAANRVLDELGCARAGVSLRAQRGAPGKVARDRSLATTA